ncbi:MAG: saccharopine dehydrogenase NADP-binding domain-containing protein [Kibdelosporangium sp.]
MTIAVYGATGYTGRLVLAELARRDFDTVLVGRDLDRLAATGHRAVRHATLDHKTQLVEAFRDCELVINCVAPFIRHGLPVVRAAVAAGAHYLDISGEQTYIKSVFDAFAEDAGVTIVPMVNDGGFLADLLVGMLAGPSTKDVVVAHQFTGGALSRGSARTALANAEMFTSGGLTYTDGKWQNGIPLRHPELVFPGDDEPTHVVRFPLPEIATIPRHVPTAHVEGVAGEGQFAALTALTPDMLGNLPTQAPAERTGRFELLAEVDGKRGVIEGADTYGTTAIVVAEAAQRLLSTGAKPGVLAPAQAFDPVTILDSLAAYGVTLRIEH